MKKTILVLAACVAAFCAQFANANETTFAINSDSTNKVRFVNVSIEYVDGLPVLVGKLKKRSYNSSVVAGHVDYLVKNSDGNVLAEGGVQYTPSLVLRKWRHGSSFSVQLPEGLPTDATIQVGFHRNSYKARINSSVASHTENNLL